MLILLLILVGLVAGLARGGRISNIAKVELRHPWMVFLGLGIQVSAELVAVLFNSQIREGGRGILILGSSYAFLVAFVALNRKLPGIAFIGIGLALNLAVIAANGGMPVSMDAARAAGLGEDTAGYLGTAVKHREMGPDTVLWLLGDLIPIPILRKVVSIGDVVLGAGVGFLVARLVSYPPRRLTTSTRRGGEPI